MYKTNRITREAKRLRRKYEEMSTRIQLFGSEKESYSEANED